MQKVDQPQLKKDLWRQSAVLEETLKSFGIEAKVGEIHSGPTITSFEVHPSIGVKVQKIKALENDIALNMQAKSIRIVAPIPGKAAVGVEVPALHPQDVSFKEMLLHYQQKSRKLQVPILLGKGVSGEPVFSDLTKMPHLLIAGATGSGKSVCINTIVMSILMNSRPEEVRLLMVDPKKVELTQYSRLPHMIAPVITEPHGAYAALQWLVKEMQLRYEILKQLGLRNLSAFNSRKAESRTRKLAFNADPRPSSPDCRHHRRICRSDDGLKRRYRNAHRAHRPDGPRRRHPFDFGNAAPLSRSNHRNYQGQHHIAHRLQSRQPHQLADHPRRQWRGKPARKWRLPLPPSRHHRSSSARKAPISAMTTSTRSSSMSACKPRPII